MQRRDALKLGLAAGATAAAAAATFPASVFDPRREARPEALAHLSIVPLDVELAPGIRVPTIAFDGTVPGPQLTRGPALAQLALRNDTDNDTVVCSSAFAEPLLTMPARTAAHVPLRRPHERAAGIDLKSYHAYCATRGAIASGTLRGASIADGMFDQLHVLCIHRWQARPAVHPGPGIERTVRYAYASFDDRLMSASEPIKVRNGDRVRFHFANTNTLRGVTLALAQHRFLIVALDGNSVPTPRHVERVYIGPCESVDAIVTMDRPGRWLLGATNREDRAAGLGRLIEYAGATGDPVASEYGVADWDYSRFGVTDAAANSRPSSIRGAATPLSLRLVHRLGLTVPPLLDPPLLDPTPGALPIEVSPGTRYRIATTNGTRQPQSLQLLSHDVEIVRIAGRRTAGIVKDTITLPSFTRVEFEFDARTRKVVLAHNRNVSIDVARA